MPEIKILYEGKFMRLVSQNTWEYAERINCAGVVFIIAVTDDRKIVLCEQYRVPLSKDVIEIPAGLVRDTPESQDESFAEAAKRELLEETGFEAEEVVLLFEGPAAVGSSSAMIHFYQAKKIKKVATGGGDETENIKVHEIPLSEVDTWLLEQQKTGKLVDPKIFTALYFLQSETFGKISKKG